MSSCHFKDVHEKLLLLLFHLALVGTLPLHVPSSKRAKMHSEPWYNFDQMSLLASIFFFLFASWQHFLRAISPLSIMQLDEPSWISVQPQNHAVFDGLVSFIVTASSDADTLQHLADSTIITLRSAGSQDPSVDQYRLESRILFATVFTVVKQLDAAAVQQDHLIKLVLSLRDVPIPPTVTQEIASGALDDNMNEDLSKLMNVFSDLE